MCDSNITETLQEHRELLKYIHSQQKKIIELLTTFKSNTEIKPTKIDYIKLRKNRQINNNKKIHAYLCNSDKKSLFNECNKNALDRVLDEYRDIFNLTKNELWNKIKNDAIFSYAIARSISKIASRQGSKDEKYTLNVCNNTSSKFGIYINQVPNTQCIPTKDGEIISRQEKTNRNIKDNMCHKSFDGKISGKLRGYIFAKVVIDSGGHQDNVFVEADLMCQWVKTFGDRNLLFVILIDTNNHKKFSKLKEHEEKNLLITDHVGFQKHIINNFEKI